MKYGDGDFWLALAMLFLGMIIQFDCKFQLDGLAWI